MARDARAGSERSTTAQLLAQVACTADPCTAFRLSRDTRRVLHSSRHRTASQSSHLARPLRVAPPLTAATAAMLQLLLLLPLLLSATSQAAARIPPTGRNDVSVVTTDVVPAAGTFHFVAADSPTPRYVYASDAARHVVRRKDISKGEGEETLQGQ